MIRIFFILLFSIAISKINAQNNNIFSHNALWSRLTVNKKIGKKWDFAIDYQHRRQSNYSPDANAFRFVQMQSIRAQVFYQINKTINFQIWPLMYVSNWNLLRSGKDLDNFQATTEYRQGALVSLRHRFDKITFNHRYALENRWRNTLVSPDVFTFTNRARILLKGDYDLLAHHKTHLIISEEIFYSLGKNINHHFEFDSNRFFVGAEHIFSKHFKAEIGYQHTLAFRSRSQDYDLSHVLRAFLTISI